VLHQLLLLLLLPAGRYDYLVIDELSWSFGSAVISRVWGLER